MEPELKPCPFCGNHPSISEETTDNGIVVSVYCEYCEVHERGVVAYSTGWELKEATEEAIRIWNTRVYPKDVQEAVERDKPRNPVRPKGYSNIECPTCGAHLKQYYEPEEANVPFCYHCGQRLDWGRDD